MKRMFLAAAALAWAGCSGPATGSSSTSTGGSSGAASTTTGGSTTSSSSSASSSSGSTGSGSNSGGTSSGASTGSTGSAGSTGSSGSTGAASNALAGPLAFPVPYVLAFKHYDSNTHTTDLSKVSVRYAQLLASPGAAPCVTTGVDAGTPALGQAVWVEVQAAPGQQVTAGSYAIANVPDGGVTAVTTFTSPNGSTFTRTGGAVSGNVVLTTLDANQITGSFQVVVQQSDGGSSTLSGTFDSPICNLASN